MREVEPAHSRARKRRGGISIRAMAEGTEIEVVEVWEVVDESDESTDGDIAVVEGQSEEGILKSREYLELGRDVRWNLNGE